MELTDRHYREMLRRMLLIRHFELAVAAELKAGRIPGAVHSSIGQEAAIVGACMALGDDDFITGTHRSHGHPVAKGARLGPLMAELMGKVDGVCKGFGGSMHLTDTGVGIIGESAIVGGGIPIATGAALSAQVRGSGQVSLCFFGDGAANQGTFHESINMAAIWKLPVVYFCENNRYAATTPAADSHGVEDIAARAAGYGIPGEIVDGQDVVAVCRTVADAVARARRGDGPTLVEAKTYRYEEHAVGLFIPAQYRTEAEVEEWKARDPIALFSARLRDGGAMDAAAIGALDAEVAAEVDAAVAFARHSSEPEPDAIWRYVYATPVANQERGA